MLKILLIWGFFTTSVFAQQSEYLRVGMELTYPPFEMIAPDGKPAGISVDIAQALGDYLGMEVIIDNIPYIGLISALKTDKIDCIISSMTITEERKKSIGFSLPYLKTGLCLLVAKDSSIQNIEDVDQKGKIIVARRGTTAEFYARTHIKNAKVLIIGEESLCILEVIQKKADAVIEDQLSAYSNWQKNLNTLRALLNPFVVEYWAIGVKKDNKALLDEVNTFILQFKADHGFEKLSDRYLKNQKAAFTKMGIPFYF